MNRPAAFLALALGALLVASPALAQNSYKPGSGATVTAATPVICADPSTGAASNCAATLPTGAATAALQGTGNTSLGTIATNTGTAATTLATIAGQVAVVTETNTAVTIAAGGTAQNALAANASRKGWCVQADPANTTNTRVQPNGTASAVLGTILLAGSNQQTCSFANLVGVQNVSVWNATTGAVVNVYSVQ